MHWKQLKVWQEAHELTLEVYKLTASFPNSEDYGLSSQLKRAAYSVPANIVEGQSRSTTKDYIKFLYNSRGSLEEIRYFLILSMDLGFINSKIYKTFEQKCEYISKLLNGLIKSLKPKC